MRITRKNTYIDDKIFFLISHSKSNQKNQHQVKERAYIYIIFAYLCTPIALELELEFLRIFW
ncbi:hypothetical protein Fmac_012851 [Flemingia macrophylla]|uniref:Uncharacterized protein n=1 Tax=Flemingia macrophylla TaxID=520843 RepID=A0ABD1MTQ4_9FABA